MKKILLDKSKNFYRGNMHCHSTLSDGQFTPEELKDIYKSRGYSFLAITDHEHINNNSYLDDEDFITITGGEFAIKQFPRESTMKNFDMKVCHLNLYAKKQTNDFAFCYNSVADHFTAIERRDKINKPASDYVREYGREGITRLIGEANEHGFFVCYNHPRWSLENYGDYSGYEGLWGVEIYNHGCAMDGLYDYDVNVLDDMLRDGKRVFASCGDDNHNREPRPLDCSFGASVYVNTDSLSYESIVNGLLCGDFYTSMAPEIHSLYVEDGRVYIECSSARQITYSTRGRRVQSVYDADGGLTEASFEIREADGYFRIDVIDAEGKRANTQAYYLDEL